MKLRIKARNKVVMVLLILSFIAGLSGGSDNAAKAKKMCQKLKTNML